VCIINSTACAQKTTPRDLSNNAALIKSLFLDGRLGPSAFIARYMGGGGSEEIAQDPRFQSYIRAWLAINSFYLMKLNNNFYKNIVFIKV